MGKEEGQRMNIDFGESPEVLKGKYMDVYDVFDENVDLSMMYCCRFTTPFGRGGSCTGPMAVDKQLNRLA